MKHFPDRGHLRRGHVTYGGVLLGVPVLLVAAALWGGSASRPAQAFDPATMWLVASTGQLVRANGLVDRPATQIIDRMPLAGSGVRLLHPAGALVAASADGRLTSIDTRTHRTLGTAETGTVSTVTDGTRLYRIGAETVEVLDPAGLTVLGTHRTGPLTGWATTAGALYVTTGDGAMSKIDERGRGPVAGDPGGTPLLASVATGVATLDPGRGTVSLVTGTSAETVRSIGPVGATSFGAAPDGRTFAAVAGRELLVSTTEGEHRRQLTFDPDGAPVLAGDRIYLVDPAAGRIHVLLATPALPEEAALDLRAPGLMRVDVHRTRGFLWFDDVRGRFAYAVRDGVARRIVKVAERPARTAPPSPTRTPATRPPTTPPTTPPTRTPPPSLRPTPSPTPTPTRTRTRGPTRSPAPSKSRTPSRSASPSVDPRARCDGDATSLTVDDRNETGPRPRIFVRVCVAAPDDDEYWIVSVNDDRWFAKQRISGRVSQQSHTVELRNGSGEPGQTRDFVVVAARSVGARDWMQRNLTADRANDPFNRGGLPPGAETVSGRVSTTS